MGSINKFLWLAPWLLTLILAFILISGAKNDSVSNDESAHIPAGWSYAKLGVYRLNDEHPPLMKLLSGLFLLPFKLNFPSAYPVEKFIAQPFDNDFGLDQWKFGDSLLFESGNNPEVILFWGRMPAILMALGIGVIVYLWTKKITQSRTAGIFAMALAVFSPLMLAHGRLANTDTPLTFFFLLTFYLLWQFLEQPNLKRSIIFGLVGGFTLAVKFSAPLIAPIILLIAIIQLVFAPRPYPRIKTVGLLLVSAIFSLMALWLPYAVAQRNEILSSEPYQLKQLLNKKTVSRRDIKAVILPADMYKQGFSVVMDHSKSGHGAFLNGAVHTTGHPEYFPIAFWLKTPITNLLLFFIGFLWIILTPRKDFFTKSVLITPVLFYLAATFLSNIHIGIRHLMPIYPFTFIIAIYGTWWLIKYRVWQIFLILLLTFYIAESAWHYPSYMAYFNQLIGSNHNHYKYLSDSNIDWYQDQKRMAEYLIQNDVSVIRSNTPQKTYNYYGIRVISPTDFQDALAGEYIVAAGWDNSKLLNRTEYRLVKHIGFSTYLYQKN